MSSSALTRLFRKKSTDDFEFASTTYQPRSRKPPSWPMKPITRLQDRWSKSSLCFECKRILHAAISVGLLYYKSRMPLPAQYKTGDPWREILAGGCTMCLIICSYLYDEQFFFEHLEHPDKSLRRKDQELTSQDVDVYYCITEFARSSGFSLFFYIAGDSDSKKHVKFHFENPSDPCLNNLSRHTLKLEASTNSPNTIMRAAGWIKSCSKSHINCSHKNGLLTNTDPSILPTRLVEIISETPLQARICKASTLGPTTKYFTLSHCWGGVVPCRLLQENINSMMKSIVVQELSLTFQQALIVTSRLDCRYIWIDALCIIQDSVEDWGRESAQMSSVYSNSFCNIAAAASTDGAGGLFRERDTRLFQPLYERVDGVYCQIVDREQWESEVEDSPLQKRAWVCQERFLPPRTLHFGSTQVFWECNTISANESFPLGFPSLLRENNPRAGLLLEENVSSQGNSQEVTRSSHYKRWYQIVEDYSKRGLSKDTDRLTAVGGLAANFETILNDRYLAGLWEDDLVHGLLWYSEDLDSSNYSQFIAPSWSWASMRSPVLWIDFKGDKFTNLINILDAQADCSTRNRFGQLRGGSLTLKGGLFLITAPCYSQSFQKIKIWGVEAPYFHMIYFDVKPTDNARLPANKSHLYCLVVRNLSRSWNTLCWQILLLESTDNIGEFRRIGMFTPAGSEAAKFIYAGMRYFDSKAAESGLEYSDNGEGGYWYTIKII